MTPATDITIQGIARRIGVAVLFGLALAGTTSAGEDCASAAVDKPILLPDGSRHEAGLLTLCLTRDFSPVTSLHLAFVDRRQVGQWLGRRGTSESAAGQGPVMVFERQRDGALRLSGYAMPSNRGMVTYRVGILREPKTGSAAGASKRAAARPLPSVAESAPTVLLAAHPQGG